MSNAKLVVAKVLNGTMVCPLAKQFVQLDLVDLFKATIDKEDASDPDK